MTGNFDISRLYAAIARTNIAGDGTLQAGTQENKKRSQDIFYIGAKPALLALAVAMASACSTTAVHDHASPNLPTENPGELAPMVAAPQPAPVTLNPQHALPVQSQPAQPLQCEPQAPAALAWTRSGHEDLWARVRAGFQLNHDSNQARVQAQLNWFATHQSYVDRIVNRASLYLYYVVEELERNNIPTELALLPIVESAYDPFAYSHGQASGIWQFIPNTGKMYGLKQNWWYDGRRDIRESTRAAIQYLSELNRRYKGDWELATAAYNAGQGNVDRAIRRNRKQGKPTDFWSLQLPKETRAYVPRLLAVAKIVSNPDAYNVHLNPVPNEPYFHPVAIGGQLDLKEAARLASISVEDMYRLNPGFNRSATDPKGPFELLLPARRADEFSLKLEQLAQAGRTSWDHYSVKSGDNLGAIAMRHGSSVNAIKQANQLGSTTIRPGQRLMIPRSTSAAPHFAAVAPQRVANHHSTAPGNAKAGRHRIEHEVQAGDSMWKIAQRYQVSVKDLARWNSLSPRDAIHPGMQLALWTDQPPTSPEPSGALLPEQVRKVGYTVRSGDSLARIASRFNVKLNDILKWNPLDRPEYLRPGQSLTLYIDVTKVNQGLL